MVKSYTLYAHPENSYVVSLCTSLNGLAVVCGHMDGSIYRFTFPQVCVVVCALSHVVCLSVCLCVCMCMCVSAPV